MAELRTVEVELRQRLPEDQLVAGGPPSVDPTPQVVPALGQRKRRDRAFHARLSGTDDRLAPRVHQKNRSSRALGDAEIDPGAVALVAQQGQCHIKFPTGLGQSSVWRDSVNLGDLDQPLYALFAGPGIALDGGAVGREHVADRTPRVDPAVMQPDTVAAGCLDCRKIVRDE